MNADRSARPLASIVQMVNDRLAGADGFLSPENSLIALDLGWATVRFWGGCSREESGETPDPSPSLGRTDAELLLAAAAVIEMDGADMLAELAADLRKRADELTNITPLRNLT